MTDTIQVTTCVCNVCGYEDPFASASLPCRQCGGECDEIPETAPAEGYPNDRPIERESIRERRARNATLDAAEAEKACDEWREIFRDRY